MSDFPFMAAIAGAAEDELEVFREYAWDFEHQRFIYDKQGNHVIVEKQEAVKVWIFKALQTERFKYLAYSNQYGLELERFIGKVMDVQERISELKRCIVECLMVNPYIKAIRDMQFAGEGDRLLCTFVCVTIYGEVKIDV